jgi:hypothetical protein
VAAGPKAWHLADTQLFWDKFVRAKQLLSTLAAALLERPSDSGPIMHIVRSGETMLRMAQVGALGVK